MGFADFTSFMAAFALAAFWLNTLLIVGAGWSECAALLRRHAFLSAGTGPARVLAGAGPGGALAAWRVDQVGRSNGRGPILFHDRARDSRVFGGVVEVGGEAIDLPADARAQVWTGAAKRRTAGRADASAFAAALPAASRAAGWARTLELPLRVGETIWLAKDAADPQGIPSYVLADFDPRTWRTHVVLRTCALVIGLLAAAGACTVACLWPPLFGAVGKLGAFAALVAFNLFQLLGKMHHDAIQPPALRTVGGAWPRPR